MFSIFLALRKDPLLTMIPQISSPRIHDVIRGVKIYIVLQLIYLFSWSKNTILSRPAPGRDFTCCGGIPQFSRGKGHGRAIQH